MKNIESVLLSGTLFFIAFLGLYFLIDDIANSNLNLDAESDNIISKYDSNYATILADQNYINATNATGLPNYEGVAAEAREAAEAKGTITSFTNAWDVFVVFPAVMLSSFTFIDDTSATYLILIIETFLGLLTFYVIIGLYKAWRTGRTND